MRLVRFSATLIPLLIGLAPGVIESQAVKKASAASGGERKLIEIKISGTKRYSQEVIVAASGLRLGDSVTEDDFKRAVQQLGESGVFSDVAYAYSYSQAGTRLELQLTDRDKFVPVRFENFVWFPDAELESELRGRAPLFKGVVPVAGSLLEQLNDALQALLLEKNLPGRVDYLRMAPQDNGEIQAINFSVNDVRITIHGVSFPGAAAAEEAALQAASKKLLGTEYVRDMVAAYGEHEWLPVYLERGYLKATFGDAQPRVVKQEGPSTEVDVAVPVKSGAVYRVEAVTWSGNQVFSEDTLRPQVHQPVGEPANAVCLQKDLRRIEESYGAKGYMTAAITAQPAFDDAKHTVRYRLEVAEGDQYKMGELDVLGLDSANSAKVRGEWRLREGEPYDASYARKFLDQAVKVLPRDATWNLDVRESLNAADKTVDVNLKFSGK